jgi:hypothetical protein
MSGQQGGGGAQGQRGQFAGRGPRGYRRGDDQVGEAVCQVLTINPDIDASEIDVIVDNGVVTLIGVVDDRSTKRLAEDLTYNVPGVNDVQNQLRQGGNGGQRRFGDQGQPGQQAGDRGRLEDQGRSADRGGGGEQARSTASQYAGR